MTSRVINTNCIPCALKNAIKYIGCVWPRVIMLMRAALLVAVFAVSVVWNSEGKHAAAHCCDR